MSTSAGAVQAQLQRLLLMLVLAGLVAAIAICFGVAVIRNMLADDRPDVNDEFDRQRQADRLGGPSWRQ